MNRLDTALLAGGALWASVALHGVLAVAAGTLEELDEPRLEFTLVEPAAAQASPDASEDVEPAQDPSHAVERGAGPAPVEAPPERLHWKQRLRRDEALFEESERDDERRMASLIEQAPAGAEPAEGIYRCGAQDRGERINREVRRDLSRLAPVLPGAVLSDAYLAKIGQIGWERTGGRVAFDLALPNELLPIALEEPDVLVAVGRTDTRCFIQISVGPRLFPLHLNGLPVRVIDPTGAVEHAVVNVALSVDASIEILKVLEGELGFRQGRMRNGDKLARQMDQHQGVFLTLKALSGQ